MDVPGIIIMSYFIIGLVWSLYYWFTTDENLPPSDIIPVLFFGMYLWPFCAYNYYKAK